MTHVGDWWYLFELIDMHDVDVNYPLYTYEPKLIVYTIMNQYSKVNDTWDAKSSLTHKIKVIAEREIAEGKYTKDPIEAACVFEKEQMFHYNHELEKSKKTMDDILVALRIAMEIENNEKLAQEHRHILYNNNRRE